MKIINFIYSFIIQGGSIYKKDLYSLEKFDNTGVARYIKILITFINVFM